MDWESIKNTIVNWISANGWNIVKAVLVFVIGVIVVKVLLSLISKFLSRTKMEKAAQGFIKSVLKFVLWLLLILIVISSLGVSITGFVVVLSAASLAISLALESSLSNLVNGFLIISTQIFKEGDYVIIAGKEGTVQTIRMLYSVLKTGDGKIITIPNSSVMNSEIINFTSTPTRRLDVNIEVSYSSDIEKAKKIIMDVIDSCEDVLADPAPVVTLTTLGASSVTIMARVWVENSKYHPTNWYLTDHIFNELKRNDISIPYNQLDVFIKQKPDEVVFRKEPLPEKKEHKVLKEEKDDNLLTMLGIKPIKKKSKKAKVVKTETKVEKTEETKEENKTDKK